MEYVTKAIKTVNDADWNTVLMMAGFAFDEKFLKGHLIASIKLMDEPKLKAFLDFFDDDRLDYDGGGEYNGDIDGRR